MKPDWSTAPEWAKHLAMDEDGVWYWYENKPERMTTDVNPVGFWDAIGGRSDCAGESASWVSTREERPNE